MYSHLLCTSSLNANLRGLICAASKHKDTDSTAMYPDQCSNAAINSGGGVAVITR